MEYCTLWVFQPSLEATMWGQCYDVSRQLVQRGEASVRYTLSLPYAVDMQQFNQCQMARSIL